MSDLQGGERGENTHNITVRPTFRGMEVGSGMINGTDELEYPWGMDSGEELECGGHPGQEQGGLQAPQHRREGEHAGGRLGFRGW